MSLVKTVLGMLGRARQVIFEASGNIIATNVQDAIEELDSEKQSLASGLTDIAGLTPTDSNIIVGDGSNWVQEAGATARTSLGVAIGTDVQAYDAGLDDIASLAVTDGNIVVGDGTNWVTENGATARTSLGVAIGTDVQAFDAGLSDISGLTVTDGNIIVGNGTSWVAESGATARTSLGLAIGTNVQAFDAGLGDISGLAVTDGNIIVGDGANWVAESGATARTSLGVAIGTDVQAFQAVQTTGTWETGTETTESVVSPAKVKAAIDALAPGTSNGSMLQSDYAEYKTYSSLTTAAPLDDTILQSTEGAQILAVTLTPGSTTNIFRCRYKGTASGNALTATAGLFVNSETGARAQAPAYMAGNGVLSPVGLEFEFVPGTVSAVTVKIRIGPNSGTMYLNGDNVGRKGGGVVSSVLIVEEIKAS